MIHGEYMASITKQLITNLEEEKHTCAEYRLSVYLILYLIIIIIIYIIDMEEREMNGQN